MPNMAAIRHREVGFVQTAMVDVASYMKSIMHIMSMLQGRTQTNIWLEWLMQDISNPSLQGEAMAASVSKDNFKHLTCMMKGREGRK